MNAVASRASANRDDQVAGIDVLVALIDRDHRDVAAVDERVSEVAFIKEDRPVDGRDAHAIAVVPHARDDAMRDGFGMQHARRQFVVADIRRRETEDVGVANRSRPEPRAERIADDAAHSRIRPAVGFESRRMIVRLDLDANVVGLIKFHDAGVVLEDADAPIIGPELTSDRLRCREDGFLEHAFEATRAVLVGVFDAAAERLVRAMLAPGLSDGFQFDIRRIAVEFHEVRFDRPHLFEAQIELPDFAERRQRRIVHLANGDVRQLEFVLPAERNPIHQQRSCDDMLDRIIREHLRRQPLQLGVVGAAVEPILAAGRDGFDRQVLALQSCERALRDVVGHARFEEHVEQFFVLA